MENTYSITVTNKFSLALDEDEDPLEILKLREQEREAKKKEKLSEKEKAKQQQHQEPHKKQSEASNKSKPRANKENQQQQNQPQQQKESQQPHQRNQDSKKDQGDKKLSQQKFSGGDRNVKFESREEHNNRRNREDGDRPPRAQNDFKRGPPGEGREARGDYQQREQQPYREFRNSEYGGERRGGRGRGMGRGRGGGGFRDGRGGGRGGGYDNREKREFDRRSGSDKTGVKPIDKKDGAGSHNWGTHNDDIEESFNAADDWSNEQAPEPLPAPTANDSAGSTGGEATTEGAAPEAKPVEEETRELTLDEWKALRQTRAKPQYNLRKAGEGEDLSRWKKMYALERKKEENEENEEEEEYDAAEYPQRVGRQKHLFDIEINFSDSRRNAGGRGGRGGRGRGGDRGGRGGFNRERGPPRGDDYRNNEQRSPRERQNAPKVDDEHDFPSLG